MPEILGLSVEPIIGLEVHVQLATRTKLFCACAVEFGTKPNSRVCPVCLGLPGALPVLNRRAVELALRAALALNCRIHAVTHWDRKNYFYPDLPKGYQITQQRRPLASDGLFEFPVALRPRRVRIARAHLEEDAGKTLHNGTAASGVDLNRAGTPLLEIVTRPDFHSVEEVAEFATQLQRLVCYLGVSEGVMQRGQIRFEPNVNVRIRHDARDVFTPIVEIKNLNSFRALAAAVRFEIDRQVRTWQHDRRVAAPGNKENRGWDETNEVTIPQRAKEEAADYRYFPEPDLPPLAVDPIWVRSLKDLMPELPLCRSERFVSEFKVRPEEAATLVEDRATADLLDDAADAGGDKSILARQFLGCWSRLARERKTTVARLGASPGRLAALANLVRDGALNATAAARVARKMLDSYESPAVLAERLGVLQTRDTSQIARWVDEALRTNEQAVHDALAVARKQDAARRFLTGQVMRMSNGQADPRLADQLLRRRLDELARNATAASRARP